ncbi:MAG: hypothetical protein HY700_02850 [Gemmatimonadetes bacterium]|nr:hypothetical protein [Gemmatimonadota bacterium]
MSRDATSSFEAVLADLERRRAGLEAAIAALRRLAEEEASRASGKSSPELRTATFK